MSAMRDKVNRAVAREHLVDLVRKAEPALGDSRDLPNLPLTPERAVDALLSAATVKLQDRAGKLVLTFAVEEDGPEAPDAAAHADS